MGRVIVDLQAELDAILRAVPAEHVAGDAARDEYRALLTFCAMSIQGGIDWPDDDAIHALRDLRSGYGCWLDGAELAIDAAPVSPESRDLWRVAFNGTKAALSLIYFPDRYNGPA